MKVKFIKHKNPRQTLGADILNKRNFNSYEEFIEWLYKYVVPNYYGMPNGPELWNKIKNISLEEKYTVIPRSLFDYIQYTIFPDIKIKKGKYFYPLNEEEGWDPYDLRERYPF